MFNAWHLDKLKGTDVLLNTLYLLTLLNLPSMGKSDILKLLESHKEMVSSINNLDDLNDWLNEDSRYKDTDLNEMNIAYEKAVKEIESCRDLGIYIIGLYENEYPKRLRYIPDSPLIIYAKGNIECLHSEKSVAIIGTRTPSDYGQLCGFMFGEKFTKEDFVVISGLAKGIDTAAHKGCIESDGKTVAVLAQGLDTPIYPKENRSLAEKIISTGGCLVSEYGLGVRGRPNYFVARNRIQSGLSAGVVIVETALKGGTMHTANFCIEQKKLLGCLNHPKKYLLQNKNALGNQALIKSNKAFPLFSEEDFKKYLLHLKLNKNDEIFEKFNCSKSNLKTDENDTEQLSFF